MNRNELALARPRHIFDIQIHGAHALAALGGIALWAAQAISDTAVSRERRADDRAGPRREAALRVSHFERERHGITDSWRVR